MSIAVIDATITTVGPLSISMPTPEGMRERPYNGFPVMGRGVNSEGEVQQTGYLPASTVRGALRRGAVVPQMRAAAQKGKPFSLPQVYDRMIGQNAESEKQSDGIDLIAIKKAREDDPIIDLFGSGIGYKSRIRVGHFLPDFNILPSRFQLVKKDLHATEGTVDLLSNEDQEAYLARSIANSKRADETQVVSGLKRKIQTAKKKGEDFAELEKALDVAEKELAKYEDAMGDMKVSSKNLPSYYALPAGLELTSRIVIEHYRQRDIELLREAMNSISKFPFLGAQSARGCGEIKGKLEIKVDDVLIEIIEFGDFSPIKIVQITPNEVA
ncbi:RAMP superfamily CRISPR-associated protein [Pseudopelagicola sp. nBUS_19]|uniref:RAMP superfamily CRISPR-associated protein n=1 Tax=Pseudopelagicola sp. nBUS_19 TaxID=3395316 RepID=UPI003EBB4298